MRIIYLVGVMVSIGWLILFAVIQPFTIPFCLTAVFASIAGFHSAKP